MTYSLLEHSEYLTKKKVESDHIETELLDVQQQIRKENTRSAHLESARDVVNTVLLLTQEQVKQFVEEVVSLALSIVYGDGYSFELEYDIKRNQSEVTPWIVQNGDRFAPRDEVGGGVKDVCSFALRLALYSLMSPKPAPVFILDEPGRFLGDKQGEFGRMIKSVSEMLGVQILMVTHSREAVKHADLVYSVTQEGGISRIQKVEVTHE